VAADVDAWPIRCAAASSGKEAPAPDMGSASLPVLTSSPAETYYGKFLIAVHTLCKSHVQPLQHSLICAYPCRSSHIKDRALLCGETAA
jgi:hypothetical protein